MGVYYSATPPIVQLLRANEAVPEHVYDEVGEQVVSQQVRIVQSIPEFVEPEITKSALGWYEFHFEWYQIVTDGD